MSVTIGSRSMRVRGVLFVIAVLVAPMCLAGCAGGGGSAAAPPSTAPPAPAHLAAVRSYLLEGENNVYWIQLTEGDHPTGILEELLAPAVSPDHKTTDWVYHLTGSISRGILDYQLTAESPGAPSLPSPLSAAITSRSLVLGPKFPSTSGDVMVAATQGQYNEAARRHTQAWDSPS